ncbi:MAG: cytochrome o ubiquinol oxidase subunit IV [Candidatus Saccharibacteria bacterium]
MIKIQAPLGSLASYIIGFASAIILTLVAYVFVVYKWLLGWQLVVAIMILAAVQLVVQLIFFLHLDRKSTSRWNQAAFLLMVMILVIIVVGSLWIMQNLNYHMMMSPEDMNKYMLEQANKGF